MRKILYVCMLLFVSLIATSVFSQNIYRLEFVGQPTNVVPKSVLVDGEYRYLLYTFDRENSATLGPAIGVCKIQVSTNTVVWDSQINLSANNVSAIDIENFGVYLYVLARGNENQSYLIVMGKTWGEYWNPQVYTYDQPVFYPTDLFITYYESSSHVRYPVAAVLGYSGSKISVMYFFGVPVPFPLPKNRFDFVNNDVSSYDNLRFNECAFIEDTPDEPSIQISGRGLPLKGGFSFRFALNGNISKAYQHKLNDHDFTFFKQFMYDGVQVFYGQIKGGAIQNQNGDFFMLFTDGQSNVNPVTLNNPYFYAFGGDSHSNEYDPVDFYDTFTGYYFDPTDILNPRYAFGLIDALHTVTTPVDMVKVNTYELKTPYVPGQLPQGVFAPATGLGLSDWHEESTAFFQRGSNPLNNGAYYLKDISSNTSCNSSISFTQTFDKLYSSAPFNVQFVSSSDAIRMGGINSTQVYASVAFYSECREYTGNSTGNPPDCPPGMGCNEEPVGGFKKGNVAKSSLIELEEKPDFKVSPIPTANELVCTSKLALRVISLFDMSGKKLLQVDAKGMKQIKLSLSNLAKGTYTVQAIRIDGRIVTEKILKL